MPKSSRFSVIGIAALSQQAAARGGVFRSAFVLLTYEFPPSHNIQLSSSLIFPRNLLKFSNFSNGTCWFTKVDTFMRLA